MPPRFRRPLAVMEVSEKELQSKDTNLGTSRNHPPTFPDPRFLHDLLCTLKVHRKVGDWRKKGGKLKCLGDFGLC